MSSFVVTSGAMSSRKLGANCWFSTMPLQWVFAYDTKVEWCEEMCVQRGGLANDRADERGAGRALKLYNAVGGVWLSFND